MIHRKLISVLFVGLLFSCSDTNKHSGKHNFDKQAHRGGRGLMPENTIASERLWFHTTLILTATSL
jgi:hypothetical protein